MQDRVLAGRYRLVEAIGRGTSATVWRGEDEQLGLEVAVKTLHPAFAADGSRVERFEREARALAALGDPSIVKVYDVGRDHEAYFIVEELIAGTTLAARIAEEGALEERACRLIGATVAHALSVSHAANIVHRDVKPQNVLIGSDGRVAVTDFGIARGLAETGLTQTGTVLGTAKYISPEQATGALADERSDIYALGTVLYEMATGRAPFVGDDAMQVAQQHVTGEVTPPRRTVPELSEAYERIVLRCLAKSPGQRFATAAEVEAALEGGLEPGPLPTPGRRRRIERPDIGRPPVWASAATLGVLLLLVGAVIGSSLAPRPSRDRIAAQRLPVIPQPPGFTVIQPLSVRDHDPEGDGSERPGDAANVLDNDGQTFWRTDRYNSAELGNLKSGVGLVFDFGRPVRLSRCSVVAIGSGAAALVRASADAENWTDLAPEQRLGPRVDFTLDRPGTPGGASVQRYRYALLWITRLSEDPDGYRARIAEVTFAQPAR